MNIVFHIFAGLVSAGITFLFFEYLDPWGLPEIWNWGFIGTFGVIGLIFGPAAIKAPLHFF